MEPELVIIYSQERLPVEEFGYQPTHKSFDLQFVLLIRPAGGKSGTEIVGVANQ